MDIKKTVEQNELESLTFNAKALEQSIENLEARKNPVANPKVLANEKRRIGQINDRIKELQEHIKEASEESKESPSTSES